jgi:hypothetical protein
VNGAGRSCRFNDAVACPLPIMPFNFGDCCWQVFLRLLDELFGVNIQPDDEGTCAA